MAIGGHGLSGTPVHGTCMQGVFAFGLSPNKENHICGVQFMSADQQDNGDWKCSLEECKNVAFGGCSSNNGNGYYAEATMNVKVNPAS